MLFVVNDIELQMPSVLLVFVYEDKALLVARNLTVLNFIENVPSGFSLGDLWLAVTRQSGQARAST